MSSADLNTTVTANKMVRGLNLPRNENVKAQISV